MRARIAQVEAQRWTNPLVYGLAAIAALALVLAALAWRRQGSKPSSVWWQEPPASDPALGDAVTSDRGPGPQGGAGGASGSDRAPAAGDRGAGSGASGVAGGPAAASSDPLRASSLIATGRAPGIGSGDPGRAAPSLADLRQPEPLSLSTNELSDIQQEADFFVSLGEYDRAIEVLRNHIEIHPQASALAWLDLLEIQHKLGRKEDYEQLRHDFEWLFNARVPAFEDFDRDQNGLEDHPDLLVQIQDLWPGREVLEVIDAGIFRAPAESKDRPLSLQAYRDLLFLHQLARDITELSEPALQASAFGGDGPSGEVLAPARLLAGQGAGAAGPLSAAAQALSAPGAGSGLRPRELDINLDEILAHPTAASDPTQAPDAQAQFEQGLDELLNFDLDMGGADGTADRKTGGKSTG